MKGSVILLFCVIIFSLLVWSIFKSYKECVNYRLQLGDSLEEAKSICSE